MLSATPRLAAPASSATTVTMATTATRMAIWAKSPGLSGRRAAGPAQEAIPLGLRRLTPRFRARTRSDTRSLRALRSRKRSPHGGRRSFAGASPARDELPPEQTGGASERGAPRGPALAMSLQIAASSSMPSAAPSTTRQHRNVPGAERASAARRSRCARRATTRRGRPWSHEHVGHLHDPLSELQHVAGAGLNHQRDGVADLLHIGPDGPRQRSRPRRCQGDGHGVAASRVPARVRPAALPPRSSG